MSLNWTLYNRAMDNVYQNTRWHFQRLFDMQPPREELLEGDGELIGKMIIVNPSTSTLQEFVNKKSTALCFLVNHTEYRPVLENLISMAIGRNSVLDTVLHSIHTLWARGMVSGSLLTTCLHTVGLFNSVGSVLGIVVDNALRGSVGVAVGLTIGVAVGVLSSDTVHGVACIGGVDESLEAFTISGVVLHHLLVLSQSGVHLIHRDVVEKDARSKRAWYGCS